MVVNKPKKSNRIGALVIAVVAIGIVVTVAAATTLVVVHYSTV
jgi:hypothetical protein